MATILVKRGLEANRLGITPAAGEAIWTTDNHDLWIGDGATAGGIKVTENVESLLGSDYYTITQSNAAYVEVSGDTMTGALILNADPVSALGAATKQYVDGLVDSNMKSPDGYATVAGGNYPTDYKGSGVVAAGDVFYITSTANGTTVGTKTVNNGDMLVALSDAPGDVDAQWAIVESNRDQATETVKGVVELATQAEVDAGVDTIRAITPATLAATTNINQEAVEDIVGGMIGAQAGIAVTYDDPTGTINYDVNDFDITITGAATASATTVTNLGNVSIATNISSIKKIDDVNSSLVESTGDILIWDDINTRWDSGNLKSIKYIDDVFTSMFPNDGEVLTWDNANSRWDSATIPAGVTTFAALTDTPANFTGASDKILKVNSAGNAVEFTDVLDGGTF